MGLAKIRILRKFEGTSIDISHDQNNQESRMLLTEPTLFPIFVIKIADFLACTFHYGLECLMGLNGTLCQLPDGGENVGFHLSKQLWLIGVSEAVKNLSQNVNISI